VRVSRLSAEHSLGILVAARVMTTRSCPGEGGHANDGVRKTLHVDARLNSTALKSPIRDQWACRHEPHRGGAHDTKAAFQVADLPGLNGLGTSVYSVGLGGRRHAQ
jgi:hypothetical protein